ncbi:MAG: hypothetical protein M3441_19585 [Chloroflexota bacterium]|nr:hypothetical protein [Chloroflexota bacterium]
MLRFTYKIEEHGWATTHISDGANELTLHSSRVTGGDIEDLAEKVVALLRADQEGVAIKLRCSWGDEPGEYRWVLENDGGNLRIDILWFDNSRSRLEDEKGKVLFATQCSLLKFAIQIKTELRSAVDTIGKEEYKKRSGRDFPERIYDELKSLIRAEQLRFRGGSRQPRV